MSVIKSSMAVESHFEHAMRIDRRISMEAEVLATFVNTIREAIPSLMGVARKMFEGITLSSKADDKKVYNNRMNVVRMLDGQNYVHLSALSVYVPEGFQGNLLDYAGVLQKSSFHAAGIVSDVLNPFNTFLSQLLSSQNARLTNYGQLSYLSQRDAEREKQNKSIGQFFKNNTNVGKQAYGKVLRRNSEWNDLVTVLPQIDQTISSVSREMVQRAVDDCVSLIDSIKTAAEDGTLDNMSAAMIKQLSQATLSAAREVEFYAITAHRASALSIAVDDSLKSIETALK